MIIIYITLSINYSRISHISYEIPILVGGIPTPLKNMKVSWDDDIPNIWKKHMFQSTNQY
jgi:hypothetical protein